jgi:hypothetical protein
VPFIGGYAPRNPGEDSRGEGKPATFTFLGFTHFCGKRQNGALTVWRETAKKPMVEGLKGTRRQRSG